MRCCTCASAARIPSGSRASWRAPLGVKPFEVGFAGLKDRNAVTTQHFTVPRGKRAAEEFTGLTGEGYEVLSAARAPAQAAARRARGQSLRNHRARARPAIRRSSRSACSASRRAARLTISANSASGARRATLSRCCVPRNSWRGNRHEGASSRRRERRGRDDAGFMLSAARSLIFNAILAERVARGTWNRLGGGRCRESRRPRQRVRRGPASTRNSSNVAPRSTCIRRRRSPVRGSRWPPARCWRSRRPSRRNFPRRCPSSHAEGMKSERRALRIRVRKLAHEYAGDTLRLRFALSAGSFATTVLREIIAGAATGE